MIAQPPDDSDTLIVALIGEEGGPSKQRFPSPVMKINKSRAHRRQYTRVSFALELLGCNEKSCSLTRRKFSSFLSSRHGGLGMDIDSGKPVLSLAYQCSVGIGILGWR